MDNKGLDRIQADSNYDFKHNLVDNIENNTPYESIGHNCSYYEQDEFNDKTKNLCKLFLTCSHNVRSLTVRWNEFSELIISLYKNNFKFSVVAIQELWNVPPCTEYKQIIINLFTKSYWIFTKSNWIFTKLKNLSYHTGFLPN